MDAKLSPGSGVLILLGVACLFASNHLCARIAFDHGASVVAAGSVRGTLSFLLLVSGIRREGSPPAAPPGAARQNPLPGPPLPTPYHCLSPSAAAPPASP